MTEYHDSSTHLDEGAVSRYADGAIEVGERARIESHLADCSLCREELGEVGRIVATRPRRRRVVWLAPVMAAAAALVIVAVRAIPGPAVPSVTRDPALTETLGPTVLGPRGPVGRLDSLRWTAVSGATRYRVTLFAPDGRVIWEASQPDTVVALPDSVSVTPDATHYWQVKAETGYGRWVESELVPFTLSASARPR